MSYRIGIDLGGTKIEGALLAPSGVFVTRERVATPRGDYAASLAAIRHLVGRLESALPTGAPRPTVGVGIPGTMSRRTGLVKNANSTWLIGEPLDRDLAGILDRPVRVANDADCFALAEAVDGAATGASPVFGVILGTGVGGGLVVGGRPLTGPNGIAGEWGHNPLPWRDPVADPEFPCYCGKRGCIETFLSGPGLAAHHRHDSGQDLDPPTIVARAGAGDAAARASLERYADRLARGLAHVINLIDPEVVVLGGGLSDIAMLYDAVPARWGGHVFSDQVDTDLRAPVHGGSAGVRGAAWLWRADDIAAGLHWAPGEGPAREGS